MFVSPTKTRLRSPPTRGQTIRSASPIKKRSRPPLVAKTPLGTIGYKPPRRAAWATQFIEGARKYGPLIGVGTGLLAGAGGGFLVELVRDKSEQTISGTGNYHCNDGGYYTLPGGRHSLTPPRVKNPGRLITGLSLNDN